MTLFHLLSYFGLGICLLAVVVRSLKIARLPVHMRWELYPVAHEKGRARYGGSYLEESDWWTKRRRKSMAGELKVMIPEILLLSGVRERNRSHWARTFPFHLGLYLVALTTALLVATGIAQNAGATVAVSSPGLGAVLAWAVVIPGYTGFGLVVLGASSLLVRRLLNVEYREYTRGADYFNLLLIISACVVALIAQAANDPDFARMRAFFAELSGFRPVPPSPTLSPLLESEVVLLALLVAYIPLTHMAHFFTKFFMYHDIRWSDEPLRPGTKLERKVQEALNFRPDWSAPHIGADGSKTWADIATSNGPEQAAGEKTKP